MLTDVADTVEAAHVILAGYERSFQYVPVPAPKHLDDEADCAPLAVAARLETAPPPCLHASPR